MNNRKCHEIHDLHEDVEKKKKKATMENMIVVSKENKNHEQGYPSPEERRFGILFLKRTSPIRS